MNKILSLIILCILLTSLEVFAIDPKGESTLTSATSLSDGNKVRIIVGTSSQNITWANMKASLKTVNDLLYEPVSSNLAAIAALTFADASIIQLTGAGTVAVLPSGGNNYILGSNSGNTALEFKTPADVRTQIGAQAALTNPVTGPASPTPGYLTKWGPSGDALVDGLNITAISDSTSTTSSTSAASSTAVKTAYDLANGKQAADADLSTLAAPTAWRVFYSNGTSVMSELALGADGTYFKSNGASSIPSFAALSGGGDFLASGTVPMTGALDLLTTGVKFTGYNGSLTLLGQGDGQDENFTLDFNGTANKIGVTSSTGVTGFNFGTMDIAAGSFSTSKSSGIAGQSYRYEANSTDLDYIGEIGAATMTSNSSYLLQDIATAPTTNQVKIVSSVTGTGTPADPFIFAQDWSDIIGNPLTNVGDLLIATTSGAPDRLAAVATGQPLMSKGVNTKPGYAGYYFVGTADQTYTFPSTSKTLAASDGSNISALPKVSSTVYAATTSAELAGVLSDEKGSGKVAFDAYPVTTLTPSTSTNPLTIDASVTESLELAPTGTQTQTIAFSGNPSAGYARYVLIHITTAASGETTIDWPTPSSTFGWIGTAGIDGVALTASKEYQYACEVGPTKTRCKIVEEAY